MKFWLSGTTSIHIYPLLPMIWQYTTSQNLVSMYLEIWETATVQMSHNDAKLLLLSMIFDLDLWSKRSLPMILIYWGWSWSSLMMILIFDLDQISSDLPELWTGAAATPDQSVSSQSENGCPLSKHHAGKSTSTVKAWLFAKLQPGRARKRIKAT